MAIIEILEAAEGGHFFRNAAAACGLDEAQARSISAKLAPAIAQRLKDKVAKNPDAFDTLLDSLGEDSDVDLSVEGSLTDMDAQTDGNTILGDIYDSAAGANAVLKGLGGPVDKAALSTLASINATAVLSVLAASNAQTLSSDAAPAAASGGLISIIIEALLKGFMQSARRQLAPKRRRRRYTGYFGQRRAPVRRRKTTIGIDDIFKAILGGRR
jgi:hypothetical protein